MKYNVNYRKYKPNAFRHFKVNIDIINENLIMFLLTYDNREIAYDVKAKNNCIM